MNSRYGLWILPVCLISLVGCANWQNRSGYTTQPGNAAGLSLNTAPAPDGSAPVFNAGPGSILEPPPPVAPPPSSDPGMSLPPTGAPEKLNLASSGSEAPAAASPKLYNLESSSNKSSKSRSETASASKPSKSSTISKLAEKSKSESAARTVAKAEAPEPARKSQSSALARLARESANGAEDSKPAAAEAPKKSVKAAEEQPALPRPESVVEPAPVTEAPPADEPSAIDTMMLAQPVRKGATASDSEGKSSKGPQSRVIPDKKSFKDSIKPVIYPVSNPATEEPVDITQFS